MGGALVKPEGDQVILLPAERPGESKVIRNILSKDGLIKLPDSETQTTWELFQYAISIIR